jgi:hypothetical protein
MVVARTLSFYHPWSRNRVHSWPLTTTTGICSWFICYIMRRRTMVHDQKSLFIAMNKLVVSPSSIYHYMLSFNQSINKQQKNNSYRWKKLSIRLFVQVIIWIVDIWLSVIENFKKLSMTVRSSNHLYM